MVPTYGWVTEFHEEFGIPGPDDAPETRWKLIREEVLEVHEAIESGNRVKIARELADLVYQLYGTAIIYDVNLDEAIRAVHEANMRKRHPDGSVHRDENGKILKPEGWQPPNLKRALTTKAPEGTITWLDSSQPSYWKIEPGGQLEFDDRADAEHRLAELARTDLNIVAYNIRDEPVTE